MIRSIISYDFNSNGHPNIGTYFGDVASGSWSAGYSLSCVERIAWGRIYMTERIPYKALSWSWRR